MNAGSHLPINRKLLLLVGLLALLYGSAHLAWYLDTPLGRSPVLDERENLQLAAEITNGTLPAEPFYRAMGYPLLLAALRTTGLLADERPQVALLAGLLLHVLNSVLVARLAGKWFGSPRAGLMAGLLHGLNPVLIHYATQILDGTLANTLVLLGLQFLPKRDETIAVRLPSVGLSLAWACAALVRPQLLLLWLVWPFAWLAATDAWRNWRRQIPRLLLAVAAGGMLWLAQGLWCWRTSGEFRLLPWQGAYNLWAANRPGANGRYYTQSAAIIVSPGTAHENPARLESLLLYRQATGDPGPWSIEVFNRYWQSRLLHELLADPAAWLRLEGRKLCYLANNAEQYNNKTYAFHRARSPWLRFNPLGWGLLLLAAVPGGLVLRRQPRIRAGALLLPAAAIAAGILLSYVSARFRLPLAALLCVLAGGATEWRPRSLPDGMKLLGGLALLAVITFGGWFNASDRSTYLQDHLLLATAAERTGEDRMAWDEGQAALTLRPGHPDALRLTLTSYFNLLLTGAGHLPPEAPWLDAALALSGSTASNLPPAQNNLVALALWRGGLPLGAELWRKRGDDPESLAALILSAEAKADEQARFEAMPHPNPGVFEQLLQGRRRGDPALTAAAGRIFPAR